jgi:hypothetical protein
VEGWGISDVLDGGEVAEIRHRELGEVIILVEPLADAVKRCEGAEHEGESRGEFEGHVIADAEPCTRPC